MLCEFRGENLGTGVSTVAGVLLKESESICG